MGPQYKVWPIAITTTLSNNSHIFARGWWIDEMTTRPSSARARMHCMTFKAELVSRPVMRHTM